MEEEDEKMMKDEEHDGTLLDPIDMKNVMVYFFQKNLMIKRLMHLILIN
jgi:hypothetical protein